MPTYCYSCENGHEFERVLPISEYKSKQICECGLEGKLYISKPTIFMSPDVHYTSPIDGRPITSMRARLDDLARNNCTPYDPEIKTDYKRRIEREQQRLERSVEATVEATIEQMPAAKRERLDAELRAGADVGPTRQAAPFTTVKQVHK